MRRFVWFGFEREGFTEANRVGGYSDSDRAARIKDPPNDQDGQPRESHISRIAGILRKTDKLSRGAGYDSRAMEVRENLIGMNEMPTSAGAGGGKCRISHRQKMRYRFAEESVKIAG